MKQIKYYVFTVNELEAMIRTAGKSGVLLAYFQRSDKKYTGQLNFTPSFEEEVAKNWKFDEE